MIKRLKTLWERFFSEEMRKTRDNLLYVAGVLILGIIIFEGLYIWNGGNGTPIENADQKQSVKKIDGMTISPAVKMDAQQMSNEIQGVSDSGFELALYRSVKNMKLNNAAAGQSVEKFHSGKNSLKIDWKEGQNKFVQLDEYFTVKKDSYYKLGLWISSAEESHLGIYLVNGEGFFPVADAGVVANGKNDFHYYEYNFRSPADASTLEFFVAEGKAQTIFIDDVKLLPLAIGQESELGSIEPSVSGSNLTARDGQEQTTHPENTDALAVPGTMFGQVFSPQESDLIGATFDIIKKGDGGTGNYSLELREFDDEAGIFSDQRIAVANFSSKNIGSELKFFPLFAKLDVGKKYWIGFSNSGVKTGQGNNLAIGQAGSDAAYPGGDGFMKRGENEISAGQNDLYFSLRYAQPMKIAEENLPYGETVFDLGMGKKRADFQMDPASGSNVLDASGSNNVVIDKWRGILLSDNDAYVTYKINTAGKKIESMVLESLSFHNNIKLDISTDGNRWTDIFSDNTVSQWQNSGRVEVDFADGPQEISLRMRKNGDKNSYFLGGYAILNLTD